MRKSIDGLMALVRTGWGEGIHTTDDMLRGVAGMSGPSHPSTHAEEKVSPMQTDYFVLEAAASNDHPMLAWDEYVSDFAGRKPFTVTRPLQLRLGKPVPRNPVMVDHHTIPEPVVSPRLNEALEPLALHGTQFVPVDVKVKPEDVRRYWILHVYNWIACMDRQLSKFSLYSDGDVLGLYKLVLDEKVLREVPLERRLVFCLAEATSTHLFHHSVVERVMAIQPEGLRFIPVEKWSDAAGFDP